MESGRSPDCRSRQGQSYGSVRRRISQSVARTLYPETANAELEITSGFGTSYDNLLPVEEVCASLAMMTS